MLGKVVNLMVKVVLLLLLSGASLSWAAEGGGAGIGERAAKREASRWTLQDWMAKKETMRWQDIWLSMNSGSPFEGSLLGVYQSFKSETESPPSSKNIISNLYGFSAYAQMLGIEYSQQENKRESYLDQVGQLNLRLLGSSIQSSNFVLHYGVRTRYLKAETPTVRMNNSFVGVSLQIYLQKYFGLEAKYKVFSEFNEPSYGKLKGDSLQTNLFIDFKALRVFGGTTTENNTTTFVAGGVEVTKRMGSQGGIVLFF